MNCFLGRVRLKLKIHFSEDREIIEFDGRKGDNVYKFGCSDTKEVKTVGCTFNGMTSIHPTKCYCNGTMAYTRPCTQSSFLDVVIDKVQPTTTTTEKPPGSDANIKCKVGFTLSSKNRFSENTELYPKDCAKGITQCMGSSSGKPLEGELTFD